MPNLLLCMLAPLVKASMRSTDTSLKAPDLVQEGLVALFEVLAALPSTTLSSCSLVPQLGKALRKRYLTGLERDRKSEIAHRNLQKCDADLRHAAMTTRRQGRRKRCRVEVEERPDCRALLAAMQPELLNHDGVEVWIATSIEGRSFREVALSMGGANSDAELAVLEGRLRQRKSRASRIMQNFLQSMLNDRRRRVGNDDRETRADSALLAIVSGLDKRSKK